MKSNQFPKIQKPYIDFDHKTIRLIRYIKWHKNATLYTLQKKFKDDADTYILINLCRANYLTAILPDGKYSHFDADDMHIITTRERFWLTPKGRKILDDRFDRLWQWSIPVLISVAALVFSVLSWFSASV